MARTAAFAFALAGALAVAAPAHAFCGFYVGKAGAELYNQASQVVLARDGDRTVVTMSNDFKGSLTDFALVVPVPSVLKREQIHIGDRALLERVDAYSSPRLVEYFDSDPCAPMRFSKMLAPMAAMGAREEQVGAERAKSLGVKVEAQYTVGEYDIALLSATQSQGLETYLREAGYALPPRAAQALAPYISQQMRFLVAKVNLKEQAAAGFSYLRPLQIAYESPKFMLPIRLGMANSEGTQDLIVYALTPKGRVESTNYRTVNVPSGMDVPLFVKDEFAGFYKAVFARAWENEGERAVHTEYVWDTGWCDPCAADPLRPDELRGLGVFWLDDGGQSAAGYPQGIYRPQRPAPVLTRLHIRYDADHFPEDLMFQETGDRSNFQARYVLRHPWTGAAQCAQAEDYRRGLERRARDEERTLADLTGWPARDIERKMQLPPAPKREPWYKRIWKD